MAGYRPNLIREYIEIKIAEYEEKGINDFFLKIFDICDLLLITVFKCWVFYFSKR